MSTIFAEATAPGRAGISVIRISGPGAGKALFHLISHPEQREGSKILRSAQNDIKLPEPRHATLAKIFDKDREIIDEALVLWMPGPHSFTGEDVAEIHVHGSRAVVNMLSKTLLEIGLAPAEPGEFTKRALLNGRMDLTEVEGLADLIDAETRLQQKQAMRQMQGELGKLYEGWRAEIISALAHIEAYIDFPDEDLPAALIKTFQEKIGALKNSIAAHLDDGARGQILRRGFYIAIVGAPNVGKSSLLNYLARRDAAIVSATPGTTRDVIEVHLDLEGYPITIADTAGIRESTDEIEIEGVKRARARASASDMKIVMLDAGAYPDFDEESLQMIDGDSLVVINKCDLISGNPPAASCYPQAPSYHPQTLSCHPRESGDPSRSTPENFWNIDSRLSLSLTPIRGGNDIIKISLKNKTGLENFLSELAKLVGERLSPAKGPVITRQRHRILLSEVANYLELLSNIENFDHIELIAENLRSAASSLGKITGRIDLEEVLDELFRSFCIGK